MNADQVRELLSNATPGEWKQHLTDQGDLTLYVEREPSPREHFEPDEIPVFLIAETIGSRDAALIAAAPAVAQWGLERDAEVARLREALNRVRELSEGADELRVSTPATRWMGDAARAALEGTS